ncbi:MAG: monovalent cation/H+ antiporter subunit D family protein [Rhodospirillales bacterium]|jgi:multicomponent Na+:H+ antiporter subunit D|nr:monovalent cation/H+ antiporter subunit D family protein [Rhodospirillales bacterium]HJO98129.1 monovalent cation/H+ antiporter subunit D family protein [Rhodospirillales bacterium]
MSAETTILLSMAVPLGGAGLIAVCGSRPNLRETVTLVSAATLFALVASLLPEVAAGGRPAVTVVEMMPGLAIALEVEPLGALFAAVASFLWIVTSVYSIGYMRGHGEHNQTRFYVCFAVALASTMGIAFSANMLTLFIFYESLTLSTYPLVTHAGTPEAMRAGRVYLGLLLGTSIAFQLLAILWTWNAAGTLDFTPGGILAGRVEGPVVGILLFLYVFGIGKVALMPFHRWLPAAMVAPTPVSALLHAVAVVKAGVFTVLKVTIYIFGLDLLDGLDFNQWLAYVAATTVIIASLVALRMDNLKLRLAYSTVSQLSYIVLGAMLANSWSVLGGGMHIAMHAFGKITLFFCAGAIMVATHKTEVSQMRGIGRTMPVTTFAFFIGSLSLIGLPPMGGMWSKWYLALGAASTEQVVFVAVFMISSLLNIAYLMPVVVRGFFFAPESTDGSVTGGDAPIREAPLPCVGALSLTALGCVVLFFYADRILAFLQPMLGK